MTHDFDPYAAEDRMEAEAFQYHPPQDWPGTIAGEPVTALDDDTVSRLAFDPVPVKARHDGWTEARQRGFIKALSETACVVSAARSVGMSGKSAYQLRGRKDAESFRAAWDAALGEGVALVESLLFQRAVKGSAHPVVNRQGEVIYMRDKMENSLLMFLLRHHKPTVYSSYAQRLAVLEDYHARTGNTTFPESPAFDFCGSFPNIPAPPTMPSIPQPERMVPPRPLRAEQAEVAEMAEVAEVAEVAAAPAPGGLSALAPEPVAAPEPGPAPEPVSITWPIGDIMPSEIGPADLAPQMAEPLPDDDLAEPEAEAEAEADAILEALAQPQRDGIDVHQAALDYLQCEQVRTRREADRRERALALRERAADQERAAAHKERVAAATERRDEAIKRLKNFYTWLNAEMTSARMAEARGEQPRTLANGEPARVREDMQALPYTIEELRRLAKPWARKRGWTLAELEQTACASLADFAPMECGSADLDVDTLMAA